MRQLGVIRLGVGVLKPTRRYFVKEREQDTALPIESVLSG